MNTTEIAAIGLKDDTERMRVISHNVANIATPGYKRQVAVGSAFSQLVDAQANAAQASSSTAAEHTDLSAGQLRATGNALDVALDDRQFLLVRTSAGAQALSRGGALSVDGKGRLVTAGGAVVQGANDEIRVPATAGQVRIDAAGRVMADDKQVGQLNVVRLNPQTSLQALGDGLFNSASPSDWQAVSTPAVHAGYTEASNVVAAQEMVQMMETMRHAESMAKLLQGSDELLEKTIRKLGEMS